MFLRSHSMPIQQAFIRDYSGLWQTIIFSNNRPLIHIGIALLMDPNSARSAAASQLASLLHLALVQPSRQLEQAILVHHPQLFLLLSSDSTLDIRLRKLACTSLKTIVSNRTTPLPDSEAVFQLIYHQYCAIDSTETQLKVIDNLLEGVLEKVFEVHYDDERKIVFFEQLCDSIDLMEPFLKTIRVLTMLVRAMDGSSVNNEVLIGSVSCVVKDIFEKGGNGKGRELLLHLISSDIQCGKQNQYIQFCTELLILMKEILTKASENAEVGSIPVQYLRNSKSMHEILTWIILCSNSKNILTAHAGVNCLKQEVITLFCDLYNFLIEEDLFESCMGTLMSFSLAEIKDGNEEIMIKVLFVLECACSQLEYVNDFYNKMPFFTVKIFELICARPAQRSLIELDPAYFVEIADDFCKGQKIESVKARAGSLLSQMCMLIGGFTTFLFQFCYSVLQNIECLLQRESSVDPHSLIQTWRGSIEELSESCLLVLSALSDQIEKRPDLAGQIRQHLRTTLPFFKRSQASFFEPIMICRYMQLAAYYPFEGCLDAFLPYYDVKPVYGAFLLNCQEIVACGSRNNPSLEQYGRYVAQSILLLGEDLTEQLQDVIVKNSPVLASVKERVLEKLVVWLLKHYQEVTILKCNKISNLLIHLLLQSQFPDADLLSTYLEPLYRILLNYNRHPAEQCLVEIATQHVEALESRITVPCAQKFFDLSLTVIEKNSQCLNSCFQLLNSLLCLRKGVEETDYSLHVHRYVAGELIPKLCLWLSSHSRDEDIWECAQLLQISICVIGDGTHAGIVDLGLLNTLAQKVNSRVVSAKLLVLLLCSLCFGGNPQSSAYDLLTKHPLPDDLPPFELQCYAIYLMRTISFFGTKQAGVLRIVVQTIWKLENINKISEDYEQIIYCRKTLNQVDDNALQRSNSLLSPLNRDRVNIYKEFRQMLSHLPELRVNDQFDEELLRKTRILAQKQAFGDKLRVIRHVKKQPQ